MKKQKNISIENFKNQEFKNLKQIKGGIAALLPRLTGSQARARD